MAVRADGSVARRCDSFVASARFCDEEDFARAWRERKRARRSDATAEVVEDVVDVVVVVVVVVDDGSASAGAFVDVGSLSASS